MRKLLLLLLYCSIPTWAATWYATTASANMSAVTWRGTIGASCAGSGTTLTWGSRAAGDVFDVNGCASVAVDVDPGVSGSKVTLTNDATNTGGGFTCATATGPATITADITATASGSAVLTISGSSGTNCGIGTVSVTAVLTGGSAASAVAVSDTHTVSTLTHYTNIIGGSSSSSATGYIFNTASGSIVVNGNAKGGSAAPGLTISSSTGSAASIINCVGSDVGNGNSGCGAGTGSSAGALTITGSIVSGKYAGGASAGKVYLSPASTASAFYYPINSTYQSTDIVDANYNVKGSPTLTNAYVAPVAYSTNGIGTGCNPANCSNVKSAITFGPYTGSATSGQNSGSAN